MSAKEAYIRRFTAQVEAARKRRQELALELQECGPARAAETAILLLALSEDELFAQTSALVFRIAEESEVEEHVRFAKLMLDAGIEPSK